MDLGMPILEKFSATSVVTAATGFHNWRAGFESRLLWRYHPQNPFFYLLETKYSSKKEIWRLNKKFIELSEKNSNSY